MAYFKRFLMVTFFTRFSRLELSLLVVGGLVMVGAIAYTYVQVARGDMSFAGLTTIQIIAGLLLWSGILLKMNRSIKLAKEQTR